LTEIYLYYILLNWFEPVSGLAELKLIIVKGTSQLYNVHLADTDVAATPGGDAGYNVSV